MRKRPPHLLTEELRRIKREHRDATLRRQARITLGASVMRVFAEGTSDAVRPLLVKVNADAVLKFSNQQEYRRWFERELAVIADAVAALNGRRQRPGIYPGYKWGHAAKILNAFMEGLVLQSHYFTDAQAKRIERWLYVPLDSYVMRRLRECGVVAPARINLIQDNRLFYDLQDALGAAAAEAGVPRIWFDDVWGDRK